MPDSAESDEPNGLFEQADRDMDEALRASNDGDLANTIYHVGCAQTALLSGILIKLEAMTVLMMRQEERANAQGT